MLSINLRQFPAAEFMLFMFGVSVALLPSLSLHGFLVAGCFKGNSLGLWLCVILWGFCPPLCSLGPGISDFSLHFSNTTYEVSRQKDQQNCGMDVGMNKKSGTGWHLVSLGPLLGVFLCQGEGRLKKFEAEAYAFEGFVCECLALLTKWALLHFRQIIISFFHDASWTWKKKK